MVAIKNSYTQEISGAQQTFRTRMDAQREEIEKYRLAVIRDEHRQLSLEQAAMEWIEKYAEYFSTDAGRL